MNRRCSVWSPGANDPVSVANSRVCLALLRIFRNVPLSIPAHDYDDISRPLWPVIRLERVHLRNGLVDYKKSLPASRKATPKEKNQLIEVDEDVLPQWLKAATKPSATFSQELPDGALLALLGRGLIRDMPEFRPLFDAMELRLEVLVPSQTALWDTNASLLSELLELSPAEHRFLALCGAIETGTISSGLLAHVGHMTRRVQALRFALQQKSDHEIHAAIALDGRLMRSGLLKWEQVSDLEDMLRLSRRGSLLMGHETRSIDDMAAIVLKPLPATKANMTLEWPHLKGRSELLQALLRNALLTQAGSVNILLYGAPGTGKTEFARHLVEQVQAQGYSVDDTDAKQLSATRDERLASLRLSQVFAPTKCSVLVLDEAEDIFQDNYNNPLGRMFAKNCQGKSWMNNLLEGNRVPVIWISNQIGHIDPAYLRRFTYCLEFPTTPRGVRRKIAHAYLSEVGCTPHLINTVASDAHVPPALLASAARFITLTGVQGSQVDIAANHVLTDHLKAMGKDVAAQLPVRATRFDLAYLNVNGNVPPTAVLEGLRRVGRGSVLLGGPPGTGKTQLAAEIAQQLGRELTYKTASDINSMWYGESERNVARMFTECDTANEVLFLDEADTLLGARESAGNRADRAVTAEFLRRVEAFEGVFVCATNHGKEFDSALMRRFVFRLNFLPLTMAQRSRLLCEAALGWGGGAGQPPPALDSLQAGRLSRLDQLTPGDFANVVKRVRALDLSLNVSQWIDELQAEHDTKPHSARPSIGFV